MSGTSAYAFDNAPEHAGGCFDALQTRYDPLTFARLADLGVTPGMRCLDVGGGGGPIAAWLADRVGPAGPVLVTDIEPRWLTGTEAHGTVRVVRHDITSEDLPEGDFDLIHARLVLDEFDSAWGPVLSAPSPEAATLFEIVHDALMDLLVRAGVALRWGHRTYGALRAAGLTDAASATWARSWPGGGAGVRPHAVDVRQVRDRLVAECGVPDADIDEFLRLPDDPAFAVNSYPLISTWGT